MEYCEAGSLEDIYKRARDLGGVIGEPVLERIAESVGSISVGWSDGKSVVFTVIHADRSAEVSFTCIRKEWSIEVGGEDACILFQYH